MSGKKASFGPFEADLSSGEVRKHGFKVRLQEKPFQILATLLKRPGALIPREGLHQALWPDNHFVEFDHNLNNAINKLREALGDSPEKPRYLETVPRRGYRFIAPVSWNGEDEQIVAVAALTPTADRGAPRVSARRVWLALVFSAAVLLLASLAALHAHRAQKNKIAFKARDWVLITNFENRTGEHLLDGTLEYAMERELSNSQFVNVVPRERADDALRLMRKPLDTTIDAALGREICLRDGGIRALLSGRVEKLGTTYVLSAKIIDPIQGITVATLSEEDPAESQMAGAVHRLSDHVREKLGEQPSLIQQNEANLEKVTTPSLKALQLYTQADRLMREDYKIRMATSGAKALELRAEKQTAAAELLEQAIKEDPSFASAHILMAWALKNQEKQDKEYVPYAKRAFELSGQTSDRERYFIQGSYHQILNQVHEAVASYEALLRLYPEHFWGASNLEALYRVTLDRPKERAQLVVRLADLRPGDSTYNTQAAFLKVFVDGDVNGARPYLERARAILTAQGPSADPNETAFVQLFPVYEYWLKGDIGQAHDELVQMDHSVNGMDPGDIGVVYLTFGEIKEAERHIRVSPDTSPGRSATEELLAFMAFIRGDGSALKHHLQQTHEDPNPASYVSVLMVRAGMWSNVERAIRNSLSPRKIDDIPEGELALARKQTARGISLLEEGVNLERGTYNTSLFLAFGDLAEAYKKQGKLDAALRVLEESSKQWGQNYFGPIGTGLRAPMWMNNQLRLSDLYRSMGREQEAKKIENELSALLIYADSDYPIRRELEKRRHTE
jgi:DNA-binding winged helix-turn-helix (wHTH) protein/tetratricopeptide (TPR) repeat protein